MDVGPAPLEPVSRWWQVAAVACVLGVGGIVAQFESIAVSEAVGGSAGIILYLLAAFWPVRSQRWFWLFMAVVVAAHGAAVALIPWPPHRRWMKGDALFWAADFYTMWGLGFLLDYRHRKTVLPTSASS